MNETVRMPDASHPEMIYIKVPVGALQCNCTIIGDPRTLEAIVIDPGDEVERILSLIGRHKLTVKAIVSTHAHIDHVGGLAKLRQYTGAPVLMHRDDLPLYHAMDIQASFLGMAPPELTNVDQLLKEGDTLHWGGFQASVMHTPGHTPGSVCLYLPKNIVITKNNVSTKDAQKKNADATAVPRNGARESIGELAPNGTLATP